MSKDFVIAGIDIGTSSVRAVIAQQFKGDENLRIIGVGTSFSNGIRRGVITDVEDISKTINEAVDNAERMAGVPIRSAILNIGGCNIEFADSKGVIAIGRADGEVSEDDINRVIAESQMIQLPMNKEIVHVIARKYRLDDQDNIKDPLGMKGVRLEVDALVIESSSTQVKNINKASNQAGIEIDDLVLEPLAAAGAVLTKKQKELGVVLINIGGGTTSLVVYEEGDLLHSSILPVGAGHITNDIAIGLRTSIEVAEKIKLEYGSALAGGVSKEDGIDLSKIDSREDGIVSRYHVAEIIEARLEEIFSLVQAELKSIGKAGLLPSGAVLVGGGSKMVNINELAKDVLGLPIQTGFPIGFGGILDKVDDPAFATVAGLVLWGQNQTGERRESQGNINGFNFFSKTFGAIMDKIRDMFKKFLP
ncbi:MAG: cell division protein FtsA [Candidatus Moranbacteria bacterium]|nr:cell division protein FtsA [Candidatus Moranbacteria bacterium]